MLSSSLPNPHSYQQMLNRIGWSMCAFIVMFDFISGASAVIDVFAEISSNRIVYIALTAISGITSSVAYMLPFFLAGVVYYLLSQKNHIQRISFHIKPAREFPLLIFAGLAAITAGSIINSWFSDAIGYEIPESLLEGVSYDNPAVVIMYMTISLSPAFAEEFLFRGVYYNELRPYGRTQAILISAALFALMHQNIEQIFYTFVIGIVMAIMYEATGSIWCSVFFHMINNELAFIYTVLDSRYGDAVGPYITIFETIYCILGVISMVILVFYYKKKAQAKAPVYADGIFGQASESVSPYDITVSPKQIFRGITTPGIIVFVALSFASMITTWILIRFLDIGGFW